MSSSHNNTAAPSAFPPASQSDWLAAVDKVLRGKPFETLVTREAGGLTRQPLYTEDSTPTAQNESGLPGFAPFIRGARPLNDRHLPWQIASRIVLGRAKQEDVQADLKGGVSALLIDFSQLGLEAGFSQLDLEADSADVAKLLGGVKLDIAPLIVRAGKHGGTALQLVLNHLSQNTAKNTATPIKAYLDFDPLGVAASFQEKPDFAPLDMLISAGKKNENLRLMTASGVPYHNAGADSRFELACILATLTAYLRALTRQGLPIEDALARVTLTIATDTDFFTNIAKLRALRGLWSQITNAYGCPDIPPKIHAEGSERSFSVADPWINILRATIATLGAGIGGADIISVAPCTAVSTGDNQLTRRVARNTHIILQEESHIGQVVDPAGGSWYVEQLTTDLTQSAWGLFQEIEALKGGMEGGMESALASGFIAQHIAAIRAEYKQRQEPLLGVTVFPNLDEPLLKPRPPFGTGALAENRFATPYENTWDDVHKKTPPKKGEK